MNLGVPETKLLPPYLPGGPKWKFEVRFFKGDKQIGGFDVFATIILNVLSG